MAERPQPHFPSPYRLPTARLALAQRVPMADGAEIATFVYAPDRAASATPSWDQAPLLVLHGNGEEHGIFGPTIDAVVAGGRPVVAVDSRAQGRSTRGTAPLAYELMAEDAMTVLRKLGVSHAHVLGFSDGAIEGLLLARDHADAVLSLVSIGANLSPEGVEGTQDMEEAAGTLDAWADRWEHGGTDSVDAGLLNPTPAEARQTAELLRMMVVEPHIDPQSLGAISCPTTVMAGEFDVIHRDETERIHRAIAGSELRIVPGAGHTLPKEVPDEVSGVALETISRAEAR